MNHLASMQTLPFTYLFVQRLLSIATQPEERPSEVLTYLETAPSSGVSVFPCPLLTDSSNPTSCDFEIERCLMLCFLIFFLFLQTTGPDLRWVDKEKPLFKVCTKLVSTVNTQVSVYD